MRYLINILFIFIVTSISAQEIGKRIYYAEKYYAEKKYTEAAGLYEGIFLNPSLVSQKAKIYPYQTNTEFQVEADIEDSLSLFQNLKVKWADALLKSFQYSKLDSLLKAEGKPLEKDLKHIELRLLIANEQYEKVLNSNPNDNEKEIATRGKKETDLLIKKTINVIPYKTNQQSIYNFNSNGKAIILNENLNPSIFKTSKNGNNIEVITQIVPQKWKYNINSFTEDTVNKIIYFSSIIKNESNIYFTQKVNEEYTSPRKLNENINSGNPTHPFYNHKSQTLYFSADKEKGKGGKDIWFSKIDKYGNADSALNFSKINSAYDEVSPFINANGSFFFSSNSNLGIGGFDVYQMTSDSIIQNLGKPFNSGKEDVFYSEKNNQKWLSSNRNNCENCKGLCLDLFSFESYSILVDVIVMNKETNEIIPDAKVQLINPELMDSSFTDEKGEVHWNLTPKTKYNLIGKKDGFFKGYDSLITQQSQQSFKSVLYLKPIPTGEITLEGILYDLAKWSLRPESEKVLDDLIVILNDNPELKIELSSHTDSRGSAKYNQKLSQKRAESCVAYLIKNGVNPKRLVAKGYGEERLKVENAKSEEEHQQNRRTSFSVIE